ncbi:MAG TPA: ribose-5-phosphate isomerase RpiA [Anaerolineae bacterium]|nr:ribose-5-phosphate isomerase RpiA [Anaerolineae bacterium]HQK14075.1 ribose-5-phosphate isomerase RpiA [Anaerolineae bacterium]
MDTVRLKQQAAEYAVQFIRSGMVVGLGHGSTAIFAVRALAARLASGELKDVVGIPCSRQVEADARALSIPLTTLEDISTIDITIDGADEVDPALDLIKGGGGALLREKIVAQASRREIIVVDEGKLVPALGTRWAVPVEVIPFGWRSQMSYLTELGAEVSVRHNSDGSIFKTDQGNLILDCRFGPIPQPEQLAARIKARAGIVDHGLFLRLATDVIVAGADGIRHLTRDAINHPNVATF